MKIGVYFNRATFNKIRGGKSLSELKYLIQEGITEKVEFFVFCPFGIEWLNKKINGLAYSAVDGRWKTARFDFPDAVYDRATFPDGEKEIGHEVRKRLKEDHNIIFLNTKHYFNKWETHQVLSHCYELRKFLPDTELYHHPKILDRFLSRYKAVYIKDSAGRLGHNIIKVMKDPDGKYATSFQKDGLIHSIRLDLESLNNRIVHGELCGKKVLIQQGINLARVNNKPFDIRILVQKNGSGKWEMVDKSIRVAAERDSVVTNVSAGGAAKSFNEIIPPLFPELAGIIERELISMSICICRCLEEKYGRLGELGIDAALDACGKVWLLEVNGKPAKACIHNSNNPELIHTAYSNIVKYFKYLKEKPL